MSINVSRKSIGVSFNEEGSSTVKVWAPLAEKVNVVVDGAFLPLQKSDYGYWELITGKVKPGSRYRFAIDDKDPLPDPASVLQPEGVHGPSEAVRLQDFHWSDKQWINLPLSSYLIYEIHTGTFSPEHNFKGIIGKLDHLTQLGVTAIEIMPVGQFPGERNWGYDGVYPFAVQNSYGGAAGLQQLVNECHSRGIAVVLDVIYNHLGPEGNYLGEFGPYFTEKYKTPWGKALNFDDAWCDGVRNYFIENALMWFRDFHIDALRMDAVHAIKDFSPTHIVKELKLHVSELSGKTGKPYYLIAEMDLNDPVFINPVEEGGYGVDAQWIDEFHHALRVSAGQPREGYYSDFNGIEHLAKSFNTAYVYDGQFSSHRKKFFGAKTSNPGHQFVVFSQNHDHTGNRMLGERTSQLVSFEMCKLLAGAVLVSPFIPMLFMGEEYAESNPFQYFISHTDEELAALVNKGRREEFSSFKWQGDPPDPRLEQTFNNSMLQWNLLKEERNKEMFDFYKSIISLKKSQPALRSTDRSGCKACADSERQLVYVERESDDQQVYCILNFSTGHQEFAMQGSGWQLLLNSSTMKENKDGQIQPESIRIYGRNKNKV
jgi:maltooligosyltrehalose trehalohydrolase